MTCLSCLLMLSLPYVLCEDETGNWPKEKPSAMVPVVRIAPRHRCLSTITYVEVFIYSSLSKCWLTRPALIELAHPKRTSCFDLMFAFVTQSKRLPQRSLPYNTNQTCSDSSHHR